jgi:S1-C subfamily serine protease
MLAFPFAIGLICLVVAPDGSSNDERLPDSELTAAAAIKQSLGVDFAVLESKVRRSIISTKTPYGFKIAQVEKDSKAAKAGWKDGDILLEWNEQPVRQLAELEAALKKSKAGDAVKFKLARYKKNEPALSRQPWEYIEGNMTPK